MMNIVAICLVMSTLLTADMWTPRPKEDVIVKDGHRVVVVEYDQDGSPNTKVSISPSTKHAEEAEGSKGAFGNVKEQIKEKASVLPNVGQGKPEVIREEGEAEESEHHATPGELICDAFGKCTHKIAKAIGRAKDEAREAGEKAKDSMAEKARELVQTVGEKASDVGEAAAWKAHDVKEAAFEAAAREAEEAKEKVSHKAQQAKEKATEKAHEARDEIGHKAQRMWEAAKRGMSWAVISPARAGSIIGVAGIATAYGTCTWVTFVSSYVLATVLGRQQFGVVQSKIYPVYFKAMSVSIMVGLAGHVLGQRKKLLTDKAEMWQTLNLLASLLMVEANACFLEPRATKAMYARMKAEKEEGRGRDSSVPGAAGTGGEADAAAGAPESPEQEAVRARMTKLGDRLRRLNSYSSCLNILTLMSLTCHLVYVGQRLSFAC